MILKARAYLITGLFGRVISYKRNWNNAELYNVESRLTLQEWFTTVLILFVMLKCLCSCRYGSSADADLSVPFNAYKESLATSNSGIFVPEPLPIYQQKGSNPRKHAIDIAFSLLQLAVGQIRMDTFADLGQLLLPEARGTRIPEFSGILADATNFVGSWCSCNHSCHHSTGIFLFHLFTTISNRYLDTMLCQISHLHESPFIRRIVYLILGSGASLGLLSTHKLSLSSNLSCSLRPRWIQALKRSPNARVYMLESKGI